MSWECICGHKNIFTKDKCLMCGGTRNEADELLKKEKSIHSSIRQENIDRESELKNTFWDCKCGFTNIIYLKNCVLCGWMIGNAIPYKKEENDNKHLKSICRGCIHWIEILHLKQPYMEYLFKQYGNQNRVIEDIREYPIVGKIHFYGVGECHFFPPPWSTTVQQKLPDLDIRWPMTIGSDWCGQWKERR